MRAPRGPIELRTMFYRRTDLPWQARSRPHVAPHTGTRGPALRCGAPLPRAACPILARGGRGILLPLLEVYSCACSGTAATPRTSADPEWSRQRRGTSTDQPKELCPGIARGRRVVGNVRGPPVLTMPDQGE